MKQFRDCYDHQDDATLVASVLAGEREAFDILLARYSSSVLHLCTALLGNTFEAQDIVQEASLQAFLGLARLQEPAHFAAWFHAIAATWHAPRCVVVVNTLCILWTTMSRYGYSGSMLPLLWRSISC